MQARFPHLRRRYAFSPPQAPVLRYGVALLSIILALIPAFLLADVVESRLLVFAVAVMVSAWYGGWKPGLAATSFALTVSGYFAIVGAHTPGSNRKAFIDLALFVLIALLICWGKYALRSVQEGLNRSELNFRSLVTNAPYGICRCDSRGIVLDANPALVEMLGYESASELAGENLANLHRDPVQWFAVADCLRSLHPFKDLPPNGPAKLTNRCRCACRAGPFPAKERALLRTLRRGRHRTPRLEQQLRQSQKMEAIGRLAGGIAHDFNNLLMVISGYGEFLLERTRPTIPTARPGAGDRQGRRSRRRAHPPAPGLQPQAGARAQSRRSERRRLRNLKMLPRLIGEDIDLVMIPAPNLGSVKADPGQIEQVIMNLAVNARDAMPHGGKLTIETANVTLDDRLRPPARSAAARRVCHARRQRYRRGHGHRNPDRTSSSRSSPPRDAKAPASACPPSTAS